MRTSAIRTYALFILLSVATAGHAQKTDKVYLRNGDILTGEIKSLKFAKLSFEMSGPGTIQIKWQYIVKIQSNKIFQVTMKSGQVLVTVLDSLTIKQPYAGLNDVVEIVPIKDKFIKRID